MPEYHEGDRVRYRKGTAEQDLFGDGHGTIEEVGENAGGVGTALVSWDDRPQYGPQITIQNSLIHAEE